MSADTTDHSPIISYDHKRIMLEASGWTYLPDEEMWFKPGIMSPIPDTLVGHSSLFNLAGQVKIREYLTAWVNRVGETEGVDTAEPTSVESAQ